MRWGRRGLATAYAFAPRPVFRGGAAPTSGASSIPFDIILPAADVLRAGNGVDGVSCFASFFLRTNRALFGFFPTPMASATGRTTCFSTAPAAFDTVVATFPTAFATADFAVERVPFGTSGVPVWDFASFAFFFAIERLRGADVPDFIPVPRHCEQMCESLIGVDESPPLYCPRTGG